MLASSGCSPIIEENIGAADASMRQVVDSDAKDQSSRPAPKVNDLAVESTNGPESGNQSGRTVAPEHID